MYLDITIWDLGYYDCMLVVVPFSGELLCCKPFATTVNRLLSVNIVKWKCDNINNCRCQIYIAIAHRYSVIRQAYLCILQHYCYIWHRKCSHLLARLFTVSLSVGKMRYQIEYWVHAQHCIPCYKTKTVPYETIGMHRIQIIWCIRNIGPMYFITLVNAQRMWQLLNMSQLWDIANVTADLICFLWHVWTVSHLKH